MPEPAGFPPILAIVAVFACAALLGAFYRALFPRPARWSLLGAAFVLGMAITAAYVYFLPPSSERLIGITDAWSALQASVTVAGLPEEAVKLAALLAALLLFRRSVSPAEAFVASLVAALGFAALENLHYARAFPDAALLVAAGRGIVASFIHSMMGMFLGTFLAALMRSNWRRWDYVVIGYLAAVIAHALVDWGLMRLLVEYLRNQSIEPASLVMALPIIIPSFIVVIVASLILFVRELKICGREESRDGEPGHLALRARWRKAGNIIVGVGIVGLVGSIAAVVAASIAMQGQPQPTDLSQVPPAELYAGVAMTVAPIFSPLLIAIGILVRQKQ